MQNFLISFFIFFTILAGPVLAQEKTADDIEKEISKATPITEWIDSENALLKRLPKTNQEIFFIFRNKHGVIRSIEAVHKDVKNAVKACGKANADIKGAMNSRLGEWEKAVLPILKEAKVFLEQELKQQEAFYVSDYRHVMKLNDKAFEFSESKIQKTPVTSKSACGNLLASMDSTEDKLVGLLQTILLPEEVVRERLEQEQKKK